MHTDKKTIGIIGGMGPLATSDLFRKIVLNTEAVSDQEHLKILVYNDTDIPDRTAAILHGGADPVSELILCAKALEKMGADLLIMQCNTAHYFHFRVQNSVNIPVLHMINITCNVLRERNISKAGLLATDGTIQSGIYQDVFSDSGIELMEPTKEEQPFIMDMIYKGVKSGRWDYDTSSVRKSMEKLLNRGAETLILGCTELPLAMEMYRMDYPATDPTLELARAAISAAGGKLMKNMC